LFLSLLLRGVGPGDEVICPSLTWCATANAAVYLGATPVFCDVDPETLCLDAERVRRKLSSRTKAVMAVHFGGYPLDVTALRAALPARVAIVEDAAHALGARFADGTAVGASGNPTCFSFYANKNLSTGEGGAVALHDAAQADRLRSLRQNGMPVSAWNRFTAPNATLYSTLTELGYKMNFLDLLATIGRVQLKRLPELQARRADVAQVYVEELGTLEPRVELQRDVSGSRHARHLFTVRLPVERLTLSRDEFLLRLRAMNVGASIHYAPLHTMPLYSRLRPPRLPETERVARGILTLPISAAMTTDDAARVARIFRGVFEGCVL
jgi:dTDP-4-amino-4,6-dideoxygalactose transaminase